MKIGFIGLGIMGSRMAANLLKHGHSLVVYNRTRENAEPLLSAGAKWADSPAALVLQSEVIITMLAHPDAVAEAALGEDGFLWPLGPYETWIDCSTVNPSFSRKMAVETKSHGVAFLGAPVTGSKSQAELGKLTFWVGGEAGDLEKSRSLLECMGNRIVHCGGPGTGASLKMVMNQLLGTAMASFAEGLVFGESLGLCREVLFDALIGGPTAAPFLALKRERIESRNYAPADFPLRWLQKDLHLAALSAYETGAAMPLTNAAKEIYRLAIRDGRGSDDFSVIYDYLAQSQDIQPRVNEHLNEADAFSSHPESPIDADYAFTK